MQSKPKIRFYTERDSFRSAAMVRMPGQHFPSASDRSRRYLGRQRGVPGAGACVSYNGNLFLNFSRNIVEADFESYFVDRIHQLGITTKQVSE